MQRKNTFTTLLLVLIMVCFFSCEKDSTSSKEDNTITDIDGNVYQTVKIGDQWWMAENLKVTHYRDGDPIPKVTDNASWNNLSTGAFCNYGNNDSNADTYGSLYNWYAVNDSRNIAPEGWHVSSDEEWQTLVNYCGGNNVAGEILKSTSLWHDNGNGNDDYGFSMFPGGNRHPWEDYGNITTNAQLWSSTAGSDGYAWYRALYYFSSEIRSFSVIVRHGFSVRCVKD